MALMPLRLKKRRSHVEAKPDGLATRQSLCQVCFRTCGRNFAIATSDFLDINRETEYKHA